MLDRCGKELVTTIPGSTLVRQARCPARPSTVTMQSKQAPIPHQRPRMLPSRCRRSPTSPAAASAAAIVSSASAWMRHPSKVNAIGRPGARPEWLSRMRKRERETYTLGMQTYMPALANGAVAMPSIFGGGQKKGGGYLTLFRGTYTVLVTPFTGDGRHIDEPALRRLVEFQILEGIHGLVPLGSTGEFLSLTRDERTEVIATVIDQVRGRVPVLVGTGAEWTPDAVAFSKEAEALGADGVMVIPPFYSVPTERELYVHYKAISDALAIPVMIYNNPAAANVDMLPETVARLSEIENVRYIKEFHPGRYPGARHCSSMRRAPHRIRRRARL